MRPSLVEAAEKVRAQIANDKKRASVGTHAGKANQANGQDAGAGATVLADHTTQPKEGARESAKEEERASRAAQYQKMKAERIKERERQRLLDEAAEEAEIAAKEEERLRLYVTETTAASEGTMVAERSERSYQERFDNTRNATIAEAKRRAKSMKENGRKGVDAENESEGEDDEAQQGASLFKAGASNAVLPGGGSARVNPLASFGSDDDDEGDAPGEEIVVTAQETQPAGEGFRSLTSQFSKVRAAKSSDRNAVRGAVAEPTGGGRSLDLSPGSSSVLNALSGGEAKVPLAAAMRPSLQSFQQRMGLTHMTAFGLLKSPGLTRLFFSDFPA